MVLHLTGSKTFIQNHWKIDRILARKYKAKFYHLDRYYPITKLSNLTNEPVGKLFIFLVRSKKYHGLRINSEEPLVHPDAVKECLKQFCRKILKNALPVA